MNNHRIAIWSDIVTAVERRISENEARMNSCTDDAIMPILVRIQLDDLRRLEAAKQWVRYHQD